MKINKWQKNILSMGLALLFLFLCGSSIARADSQGGYMVNTYSQATNWANSSNLIGVSDNVFSTNNWSGSLFKWFGVNNFDNTNIPTGATITKVEYSFNVKHNGISASLTPYFNTNSNGYCYAYITAGEVIDLTATNKTYSVSFDNSILNIPTDCWITPEKINDVEGENTPALGFKTQPSMTVGNISLDSVSVLYYYDLVEEEEEEDQLVGGYFFKTPPASELGASVGSISLDIFDSFSGWLYIVCGLFVGWYIIESIMLLFFVYSKEEREKRRNKKE